MSRVGSLVVISPSPGSANLSKSTSTSTRTESSTTSGSDARQNKDNRQSQTYNNYYRPRRDPKDIQCYNCKQMGHYAWQCVKVNVVALPGFDSKTKPPVMKQGRIGEAEHLWCMDSRADMCFISEDLLPPNYMDGPPVHAMHPDSKTCPTAVFDAEGGTKAGATLPSNRRPEWLWFTCPVGRHNWQRSLQAQYR